MPYRYNDGHAMYIGVCIKCGFNRIARYNDLKKTLHCNHMNVNGEYAQLTDWNNSRIGNIFRGMKQRCYNSNDKAYRWYGKKGIGICDEWLNHPQLFEKWSIENGYADDLTIDRIDENKDYCPDNCRWIARDNNAKYKSTTNIINVNGIVHSGRDWSELLGFGKTLINKYIRRYGLKNTTEFIHRYLENPGLKPNHKQSYYDLYMS